MFRDPDHDFQLNPNYKEIGRLLEMLSETDIPHSYRQIFDGWQVGYPCLTDEGDWVFGVIEHVYSYGSEGDRLEIMVSLSSLESFDDEGG